MSKYLTSAILDVAPSNDEYPTFYQRYVNQLPAGNLFQILEDQLTDISSRLENLKEAKWVSRYADGKWTVKEVVGHMIDVERIFSVRALCFARGDQSELPGFDENSYVEEANFDAVAGKELLRHLICIRRANVLLYSTFGEQQLAKSGVANGKPISVRALVYATAGHFHHHSSILKERYQV